MLGETQELCVNNLPIPRMTLKTLYIHVLKFKLAGRRPAVKRFHSSAMLEKKQNVCDGIFQIPPSHSKKEQWYAQVGMEKQRRKAKEDW